jgi:hypothetical protein
MEDVVEAVTYRIRVQWPEGSGSQWADLQVHSTLGAESAERRARVTLLHKGWLGNTDYEKVDTEVLSEEPFEPTGTPHDLGVTLLDKSW